MKPQLFTFCTDIELSDAPAGQEEAVLFNSLFREGENCIEDIFRKIAFLNKADVVKALKMILDKEFTFKLLLENEDLPNNAPDIKEHILDLPFTSYLSFKLLEGATRIPVYHSK